MCDKCYGKSNGNECSDSEIQRYSLLSKESRVGPLPAPQGIHLDFVCTKKSGTYNTYQYTMKFWHYQREQLSWETFNNYGQNLILEVNGREVRRHTFRFGKGQAFGVVNNPTYYHPNNILQVSGEFTITGNATVRYRTSCSYCENNYHTDNYDRFNFNWGTMNLTYVNPTIIPGNPSMSVSWEDSRNVTYQGKSTYPALKTDGNRNRLTISGSAGSNGLSMAIDLQQYNGSSWVNFKTNEGFNTETNGKTKSLSTTFSDNDRNYLYRVRTANKSSTNNWSHSNWREFRINNLPSANGNMSANIENNTFFNGLTLSIPQGNDTEEGNNVKYRLHYRTKTPSGSYGGWTYLGEYTSRSVFIQAEDFIGIGNWVQFGLILADSLEYSRGTPYCLSGEYKRNDQPPSNPTFSNVVHNGNYVNSVLPTINCNIDYAKHPTIYKVQYSFRNPNNYKQAKYQEIDFGADIGIGRFYDTETLVIPANTAKQSIVLYAKTTNIINNKTSGVTQITINLIMSEKPTPVILGVVEGGVYSEATPYCQNDPKISSYQAYLNGEPWVLGTLINKMGSYNLKVIATHAITGETGEAQVNFRIDNRYPVPIEVYGVREGDIKPSYEIHVIKQSNCTMRIQLNGNWISSSDSTYGGRNSHKFNVTDEGDYRLYVLGTHNISQLTKDFTINNFTVRKGIISNSENLIRFKEPIGPVHSSQLILHSGTPKLNITQYQIETTGFKRYSSPLLIFDNHSVRGEDRNKANQSAYATKKFEGFIPYRPEIPRINGVTNNSIYRNPVTISFTNLATKPSQAMYKIFLDGDEIDNPFSANIELYKKGYHSITILGWDNINPYNYSYHTIRFLIKPQTEVTIRKPYIIAYDNSKDLFVDVNVKFSNIDTDFVHNIKVTEKDGTVSLNKNYDYNVKTVPIKVSNNCTIVATTSLPDMNLSRTDTKIINTIFDTVPLSNIKVLGLNRYTFVIGGTPKTMYIGKQCYLEIEKRRNEEYEVYVNGFPYELGTLIENKCEEIRKYTIEVIVKNPLTKSESYFSQEFLLDSINPAYPTLMSLKGNLMNRDDLPKKIEMKKDINMSDEEFLLNNRIIDVRTQKIVKDDEYILMVTYEYYNHTIRTNSFYFSVNSNPIDNLEPLRFQLKVLDYKKSHIAKDGEFIIDRTSGHLYYKDNDKIKAITKPIEEEIHRVEEQLIKVESNHEMMQSIQFFMEDMISSINKRQQEIILEIQQGRDKLDSVTTKIQQIESNIIKLENEFNNMDSYINNIITTITVTKANRIKELTTKSSTLNRKFINLCNDLRTVFDRAAKCTEETYKLKDELATRITRKQFNDFKASEEAKFNKFVQTLRDKGLI